MGTLDIDVVGMGLVCSLGRGVSPVYEAMCRGECGIRPITRFPADAYPQESGGQLPEDVEDSLREEYPDEDLASAMVKASAKEALQAVGADVDRGRLGLVLATNFGPMETLEWCWRERVDAGTMDADTFAAWRGFLNDVGNELGCEGPRIQLSMSCASGAGAVALARDWLVSGRADAVLAVGYDALTEFCWTGLTNLHTISTDTIRPFDKDRSGTIFSEGAGAMLLAREGVIGATVLAKIAGAATNNNAFHMTAPAKEADGSRRAMVSALRDADLAPNDVHHICAHATGTAANDPTEVAAFRNVFGDRLKDMTVSAHKSQLGHLMGAAGIAEAIVTVMVMRKGTIPPTVNHRDPDPECPVDCVPKSSRAKDVTCAITNSAGIGGNNGSLVLTGEAEGGTATIDASGHKLVASREVRCSPRERRTTASHSIAIAGIGWVLPASTGSGPEIMHRQDWRVRSADANESLRGFSARPYLSSVKGYLDPAGAYCLAAASLAMGDHVPHQRVRDDIGVCTVTHYGAPGSGYRFFEQFLTKGARLASPLLFPHSYANTAGNLVAIEFGFGGPHMVFYGTPDVREALDFACRKLVDGSASEMLVGACEAIDPASLADGLEVLNGSVVLRLSAHPDSTPIAQLRTRPADVALPDDATAGGSVDAMLAFLQQLKVD